VCDVRAKIGLFTEAGDGGALLALRRGCRDEARIVHTDNLRIEPECVHGAFCFLRQAIVPAEYGRAIIRGLLRIERARNAGRLSRRRCAGEFVRSRSPGVGSERVLTIQYGGSFVSWFLLFPGARIRLVLRRSEAGRQQSQEEDAEFQPASSLMQIQV
jgi:hypothetical protein